MKSIGIVSYNINCNFTNYGSALQSWALNQSVARLGYRPVLIDYCPDILKDKDPLNPMKNMWDKDSESRKMCELSLPAIRENYVKFDCFYTNKFIRSKKKYYSENFNQCVEDESLDGFVCGSDTIFCVDEFGIDDGYYANYDVMKQHAVAYAASFGDSHFTDETYKILSDRLKNFKAIGIRENQMLDYVRSHATVPCERVLDPTLLLNASDYECITSGDVPEKPYLLYYARRYNPEMEAYAENLAKERGLQLVEISLRAVNADKGHIMRYDAGVEEFLSLTRHASYIVTNSYHSMIFAVHFKRPFVVFTREQCNTKIDELMKLLGLENRKMTKRSDNVEDKIEWDTVQASMEKTKTISFEFLSNELGILFKSK